MNDQNNQSQLAPAPLSFQPFMRTHLVVRIEPLLIVNVNGDRTEKLVKKFPFFPYVFLPQQSPGIPCLVGKFGCSDDKKNLIVAAVMPFDRFKQLSNDFIIPQTKNMAEEIFKHNDEERLRALD